MGLFNRTKAQTKMFISNTKAPKKKGLETHQKKGLHIPSKKEMLDKAIEIAPELVEESFKLLSSAIAGFTEDYTSETILFKNIDGDDSLPIFIPKHITLIRAEFEDDNSCNDNYGDKESGCMSLEDKRKLHIEINLKKSDYTQNFYFQPTHYFYTGRDENNKTIDEINISFAFIEASKAISDFKDIDFKKVISFKNLNNNQDYEFYKQNDTTFQSPWINSEVSKVGPYTIAIKIEERKYRKPFASTLNKVYKKHEDDIKKRINREVEKIFENLENKQEKK
jgi:hypothetical protein